MTALLTEPGTVDTIEQLGTATAYENPFVRVDVDRVLFPNGIQGEYSTVSMGLGLGVVAVPTATFRGLQYLGLVSQYRYPVREQTLEFPRGGSDDLSAFEANRELTEETGMAPGLSSLLGRLHPDTGILSTDVAIWRNSYQLENLDNVHCEDETGARFAWYSHGEFQGLIRNGKITCGITLAAYTLLIASGTFVDQH